MDVNSKKKSIYCYNDRSQNNFSGRSSQESISSLGDHLSNNPSSKAGKINFMKNYFWFFQSNNNSKKNSHDSIFYEIKSSDGNKTSSHQLDADSEHVMENPDGNSNNFGDSNGDSLGKTNEEAKGVSSRKSFYSIYDYTDESDYNTLRENEQDDLFYQQKTYEPVANDRYPKGECARNYMHIYDTHSSRSNDSNEESSDGNSDKNIDQNSDRSNDGNSDNSSNGSNESSGNDTSRGKPQSRGHKGLPTQTKRGQAKQGPQMRDKKKRAKQTPQKKMEDLVNSYKIKKGKTKIQYVGISSILKKYIYITKNEKILFFKKKLNKKKILLKSKIKKKYNRCRTFYYLQKKQKNVIGRKKKKKNKCHFFRYLYYCLLKKKLQIFYRTRKLKRLMKYVSSQGWRRSYVSLFGRGSSNDALKGATVEEKRANEDAEVNADVNAEVNADVNADENTSNPFTKTPSHSDSNKEEGFVSVRSCPKSPRRDGQGSCMHLLSSRRSTPNTERQQLKYKKKDTAYADVESYSDVCIDNPLENKTGYYKMEKETNHYDIVSEQNHTSDQPKNEIKNMPTYDCYRYEEEGFPICVNCKDVYIDYVKSQREENKKNNYMLSEDIITLKEIIHSKKEENIPPVQTQEINDLTDSVKCKNSQSDIGRSPYGSDCQQESFKMDFSIDRDVHSSGEMNPFGFNEYVSSEFIGGASNESIEKASFGSVRGECAGKIGSEAMDRIIESCCGLNEEGSSVKRIESKEMRSKFRGEEDIVKVKGCSESCSEFSEEEAVAKMEERHERCSSLSEEEAVAKMEEGHESCSSPSEEEAVAIMEERHESCSGASEEEAVAIMEERHEICNSPSEEEAVAIMEERHESCSGASEEEAISRRNARSESCSDLYKGDDASGSNRNRNISLSSSSKESCDVSIGYIDSFIMEEIHGGRRDHAEGSHEGSNGGIREHSNGGSNEGASHENGSSGSNDSLSIYPILSRINSQNDTEEDGPSDASISEEGWAQREEKKKESHSDNAINRESFNGTINWGTEENVHLAGHLHVEKKELQNGGSGSLEEQEEEVQVEEVEVEEEEEEVEEVDVEPKEEVEMEEEEKEEVEEEEKEEMEEEVDVEPKEEVEEDEIEVEEEVEKVEEVDVEPKEEVEEDEIEVEEEEEEDEMEGEVDVEPKEEVEEEVEEVDVELKKEVDEEEVEDEMEVEEEEEEDEMEMEEVDVEPKEEVEVEPRDTRKVVNSEEEIQNNMEMEIRKSFEEIFKTVIDNDILTVGSENKKFDAFWDEGGKQGGTIGDEEDSLNEEVSEEVGDKSDVQQREAENEEHGESSEEILVEKEEPSETESDEEGEEGEEEKGEPGKTEIGELEEVVEREPAYAESEVLDDNADEVVGDVVGEVEADETVSDDGVADDVVVDDDPAEEELPEERGDKVLLRKNAFSFNIYKNGELRDGFRMESLSNFFHSFESVNSEYADTGREGEETEKENQQQKGKQKGAKKGAQNGAQNGAQKGVLKRTSEQEQNPTNTQSMQNESDAEADFKLNMQTSVEADQMYSHLQNRIMRDFKRGCMKKMKKIFNKKYKQMEKDISDNIKTIVHNFNNRDEALEGEIQSDANVKSSRRKPRKKPRKKSRKKPPKKGRKNPQTNVHTDGHWAKRGIDLSAKEEAALSVESFVGDSPSCSIFTDKDVDIGEKNKDDRHILHAVLNESDRVGSSTGEVLRGDEAQVGTPKQDIRGSQESLRLTHAKKKQQYQQRQQDLQQEEEITEQKEQAHQQIVHAPQGSKNKHLSLKSRDESFEWENRLGCAQRESNQLELDVSTTNGSMDWAQKYFLQKLKCEKICLVTDKLGNKSELFNRINSMTKKCIADVLIHRMNSICRGQTVWDSTTTKRKAPIGSSPLSDIKLGGKHKMLLLHEDSKKQIAHQLDKEAENNPNDYALERYETRPKGEDHTELRMNKKSKELHSFNNCNKMKVDSCQQKMKRVSFLNYVKHKLSKLKRSKKRVSAKQVMKYYPPCRGGTVAYVCFPGGNPNRGSITTHGGISNVRGVNHVYCLQHTDAYQKKGSYKEQAGGKFIQLYIPHSASINRSRVPKNLWITPNANLKGNHSNVPCMLQKCPDGKLVPYIVNQQNRQQVHAQWDYYPLGGTSSTDITTKTLNNHYICLRKTNGTRLNGYYVHSGDSLRDAPSNEWDHHMAFLQDKFQCKSVSGELSNGKVKMCVNKNNRMINKHRRCKQRDKCGACRQNRVRHGGNIRGEYYRGAANHRGASNHGRTTIQHAGRIHPDTPSSETKRAHTAVKVHCTNSQRANNLKANRGPAIFLGYADAKHQMGGNAGGANRVILVDYKNGSFGGKVTRRSSQECQMRPLFQTGQATKLGMPTRQGTLLQRGMPTRQGTFLQRGMPTRQVSLPPERTLLMRNFPTSEIDGTISFYTQSQLYKDTTLKTKKKKNNLFTVNHNILQKPYKYDNQRTRKICCNMGEGILCTNTWHTDESDSKNCILKNICNAYDYFSNSNDVRTHERGGTKNAQKETNPINAISSLNTIDSHNAHKYHVKVKKICSSHRNQEGQMWGDEGSFKNVLFCNAHDSNFKKMELKNRNIESFHICSINSSRADEFANVNYRHQMENICIFRDF